MNQPPMLIEPGREVATTGVGGDRSYRQRRRGIYVLTFVCVAFFVVAISACYVAAGLHGYGTGFGDGKNAADRIPPLGGNGFWGDAAILLGAIALNVLVTLMWYFAASRMENPSVDDPVAPDDGSVDLSDDTSWYVVPIPGLTRALVAMAWICLFAIVLGTSAIAPAVAIRFGWML